MKAPSYQDLSKFVVPEGFRGKSVFIVQLWWIVEGVFIHLSPQFMYEWRNFIYRLFGAKIGQGVKIRPNVTVTYPWNLEIGNYVWVGEKSTLYNLGKIIIGNHVAIAHGVYLCTGMHDYSKKDFPIYAKDIFIQDEVWLTNEVFVAPGVTIGAGTVVGARSTVLEDLPAGMICYGSPAKPVKKREITG